MNAKPEVTRVQELVYELKISQVMTCNVTCVTPDSTIGELKELLRTKRISGVPVVQDGALVGMISIENVILALEKGELSAPVRSKMTTNVVCMRCDDTVVNVVNLFARYGYGRFPVLDASGALVGIITKGDIVRGMLKRMEVELHAEELQRYRASHIFEDIESDETGLILRYRVKSQDFVRAGEAASKIKRALERLGAHPRIIRRVAVASYEAETNLVIHSVGGEMIAEIHPDRIKLVAVDRGPGIADVEQALKAGFSTAPDWIRELGFGAGMGLSNIRACADTMKLESEPGVGTRLELAIKLQ